MDAGQPARIKLDRYSSTQAVQAVRLDSIALLPQLPRSPQLLPCKTASQFVRDSIIEKGVITVLERTIDWTHRDGRGREVPGALGIGQSVCGVSKVSSSAQQAKVSKEPKVSIDAEQGSIATRVSS